MNDDLNLLITLVIDKSFVKVAVGIKNGLNTFPDYMYFGEDDVINTYKLFIPSGWLTTGFIIAVEKLDEIMCIENIVSNVYNPDDNSI